MRVNCYRLWLPVLLCLALTGKAADRVYKWVDARGVTHYARRPPVAGHRPATKIVNLQPNVIKSVPLPNKVKADSETKQPSVTRKIPVSANIVKYQLRCEQARNRLQKVRARLRAGYKYSQNSRLRAREAEYRAQRKAWCR